MSEKSLDQEMRTQKQLNRLERENLEFKQKGDRFSAKVEVNKTRPEGRAKDAEARRLQKQGLNEVGLSGSALRQQSFRAPTADLPDGISIRLPKGLDVGAIIDDSKNEFFSRLGVANPLPQDSNLEKEFSQAKQQVLGSGKLKTILDYVDPASVESFKKQFMGVSPATVQPSTNLKSVTTPDGQIGVTAVTTPSPQASNTLRSQTNDAALLAVLKEQLDVQKKLVEQANVKKGDMYNEVAINVADASVGADEISDIFLNKFDNILRALNNEQ